MGRHPVLHRLGFAATDRVVVINADDVGMCQATLLAFADLVEHGLVSSGSLMVPCPWFPAAAAWCREHPQADVGVHLALTSEWEAYRWRPINTVDPASGLLDDGGYLHRTADDLLRCADVEAADREMRAQAGRAREVGLDLTHIDSHMLVAFGRRLLPPYLRLAVQLGVPALVVRPRRGPWRTDPGTRQEIRAWQERGLPVFDHLVIMPLKAPAGDRILAARKAFADLPPGLSCLVIHPARDTPELRAIAPDWRSRVADYTAFMDPGLRERVRRSGIHVIGYRALRPAMAAALASGVRLE